MPKPSLGIVTLNGVVAAIIDPGTVMICSNGTRMSLTDFISYARQQPKSKFHPKRSPPIISFVGKNFVLIGGCIATIQDVCAYFTYEHPKVNATSFLLWRSCKRITNVFASLIGRELPAVHSFELIDRIEEWVMEMEDEFPRDSCLIVEEVWASVKAKAQSFLETPEMKAFLEEEVSPAKRQKTGEE